MKFSYIDSEKKEAFPDGSGVCLSCGAPTLSFRATKQIIMHWNYCYI